MANYVVKNDKCFADVLDVIPVNYITDLTGSEAWSVILSKCRTGTNIYILTQCSDSYYPVEITELDVGKAAIVTITYFDEVDSYIDAFAKIEFFCDGVMYTRQYKYTAGIGAALTDWISVDTTTVT